jgi:phosphoribosylglycinamide formyltransferase 1
MLKLAILGSTRGTHFLTIQQAICAGHLAAQISVVLSNKQDALILQRAKNAGIDAIFIDPKNLSREQYDRQLLNTLKNYAIDIIVLCGYMRILSPLFVAEWHDKIINIHPSLLPDFAGFMDLAVHQAVLDAGVPVSGCTVHLVTDKVDAGPILLQKKCAIEASDTAQSLKVKVQALEGAALIEVLQTLSIQY